MINKIRLRVALALALVSATAFAGEPREISIPAGELAPALESLAKESGLLLIFQPSDLRGVWTQGVKGKLSPEEAVAQLISGTSLTLKVDASGAMLIVPEQNHTSQVASGNLSRVAQVQTYRSEMVGAQADAAGNTIETVNVFAAMESEIGVGSKTGQSLRETPKSVTVVTRERIEVQNLTSLKDILNQATGVTVSTYGPVDNFYYSRGFEVVSVQIDGGAATQMVRGTPDTAAFERVEVLRGVDGIFTGAGDPGGVINLVRKRGKATPEFSVSLSGARWDNYRGEFDLAGPLWSDGRLRGRIVGAYQEGEHYYDAGDVKREFLFGTAEYDLTPSTLLIAGASYEDRQERGFPVGGLPRHSDGTNIGLPRSTVLASRWNFWDFTTREYFARVEQQLGRSAVLRLNYTKQNQDSPFGANFPTGALDPITLTGPVLRANTSLADYFDDREMLDVSGSGAVTIFGREHQYVLGVDRTEVDGGYSLYRALDENGKAFAARPIDVFNFDPYAHPRPIGQSFASSGWTKEQQKGVYLAVGLQITDPLKLTLGGRYTEYDYRSAFLGDLTRFSEAQFVPSASITYDLDSQWTMYASYGETFRGQAGKLKAPLPGTPLDPMRGVSYELGLKGELLGRFNTAFAVYRVERDGEGMEDLRYPVTPGDFGATCCFVGDVAIEVTGFDAEVSGTVLPGWQVFAGYTYADRQVAGPSESLLAVTVTPRQQFKLWTNWQVPWLDRLTVSSGMTLQSRTFRQAEAVHPASGELVPATFSQGGYTLWNASLQWRLGDHWSLSLHGDNLLDKTYYSTIGTIAGENYYGTPRSYVLTLRGHW